MYIENMNRIPVIKRVNMKEPRIYKYKIYHSKCKEMMNKKNCKYKREWRISTKLIIITIIYYIMRAHRKQQTVTREKTNNTKRK